MSPSASFPVKPHYPTPAAKMADLVVHVIGLAFALFGGGVLLGLAVGLGRLTETAALAVYAAGLLAMLAFSTAYNFANDRLRPLFRKLDHAGIFLMIACSYTPFTTHNLTGAWAWGMTAAVWSIAGAGALAKLFLPGLGKGFWIAIYLGLSWSVLIAAKPMIDGVPWAALALLLIGGGVYMLGVVFYANKRLKFTRAIWHGHVIAAASVHWTAILIEVFSLR
jgi:hemolysin III